MWIARKSAILKPIQTFNYLQSRRISLPCTFICDQDSSGPDDSIKIDESSPFIKRKYSFSRRWYSKDEMIYRVASVLISRGWDWSNIIEPNVLLDSLKLSKILNELFSETSDAALAFFFFRWSQRQNKTFHEIITICTMIHISVRGNMNHIAMKLLRHLIKSTKGPIHDSLFPLLRETCRDRIVLETVYSMLINCYLVEESLNLVLELLDSMKDVGLCPSTGVCVTLIKKLLAVGNLECAFMVFKEGMRHGRNLNLQTVTLLIQHCSSRGKLDYAVKLFLNMKEYDCEPDLVSYTVIIDSLCKNGHLKEAMFLFGKLIQEGLSPDSVLISSLVDGYCKNGRLDEGMGILRFLNMESNEFIFNSLIHRLCVDGNVKDADSLLNVMTEIGTIPDCFNWTTVLSGYSKINKIEQALKVLGGMLKRGIRVSLQTCSILITCFIKKDEIQEVESLISMMGDAGLKLDVKACNGLIHGYIIKEQMQDALKVLKVMRINEIRPDLVTYNILIHGFVKRGLLADARKVLADLSMSGFIPDQYTYTILMNGFIKKGNILEAYKLWSDLGKSGDKPDLISCSVILSGLCKGGRVQEAYDLFNKMMDDGLVPDLELCNILLRGLSKEGDLKESIRLLNIMVEKDIIFNHASYKSIVYVLKKNSVQNYEDAAIIILQQIFGENNVLKYTSLT